MKLKDLIDFGCYFCSGICLINLMATIGRMIPAVGLVLAGLLVMTVIALSVMCHLRPQTIPSVIFLAVMAIFGLVLGVMN